VPRRRCAPPPNNAAAQLSAAGDRSGAARVGPWLAAGPWIAGRGWRGRTGLACLAGAAMTLGHPPVGVPWALFLAVPLLVWLVDAAPSARAAALTGWAAGFGYFVTGLHWIGHAFVVDAERFAWLLPFAVTLLPAGLALFWALAFWGARRVWAPGRWWRALILALALTTIELARSYVLTGFPWALPGYVWVDTPVAQAAAWAGPHGLTFLTLALAGLVLTAPGGRAGWGGAVLATLAVAGLWAAGDGRLRDLSEPDGADRPLIRIVQPNAPQHLKWDPEHAPRFFARLLEGAAAAPANGPPDLVVFPETALTFLPQDRPDLLVQIARAAGGVPVVTGALLYEQGAGLRQWRNSMIALGPRGEITARYDKHHLVPFGEYLPLRGLLESLGLRALAGMGGAGFAPGPGPTVVALPGLPSFVPSICYEMIFPHEITLPGAPRPDFILHLTNDAWFGAFAGPQQHLAQARMRAIEQGLPVIRAANTGISAVIDGSGAVIDRIALGTHGTLDEALPRPYQPTLYAQTGDLSAILLISLLWGVFTCRHYFWMQD